MGIIAAAEWAVFLGGVFASLFVTLVVCACGRTARVDFLSWHRLATMTLWGGVVVFGEQFAVKVFA